VRIEAFTMHARGPGSAELLRAVRADPAVLVPDPTRELRSFRIAQSAAAGTKRGTGRGAFIDSLLAAIDDFYERVIQNLKPWMPAPPRLRAPDEPQPTEPVPVSLVSTSISSQDGPQPNNRTTADTPNGERSAVHTAAFDRRSRVAEAEEEQAVSGEPEDPDRKVNNTVS
jgi:hypothetical protein